MLAADVALTGKARAAAGLADGAFDFAIMNPPFNAEHDRATPDELKREAHVMPDGLFEPGSAARRRSSSRAAGSR